MTMILGGCGDSDGDVTVEQVVTPDAAEPVVIPDTAEQTDAVIIVEFVWAATELSPEKLCLEVSGNTADNQLILAAVFYRGHSAHRSACAVNPPQVHAAPA